VNGFSPTAAGGWRRERVQSYGCRGDEDMNGFSPTAAGGWRRERVQSYGCGGMET
jgi:hypothetical protein